MKKVLIPVLLLVLCSFVFAEDEALLKLKANHDAMIKKMGDVQFLTGTHYFVSCHIFNNLPASVYSIPKQKCIYSEYGDRKLYRAVDFNYGNNKVDILFTDKLVVNEKIYTLGYTISFITGEKSGGYFVTLDKDHSDIMEGRADWAKILACILKYGEEIYGAVKECIQKPDVMECMKIIGPAMDIYKCISESLLGTMTASQDRAIVTQTIYFSWSWGYSTGFKAPPVYQEMPNAIIGFDSVTISRASNAWNIQVGGSTTGSNVAVVSLNSVTYMCYPTFWSSSVSGSIRCVMQK